MTQKLRGRAASVAMFTAALVCAGPLAAQMRAKFDLPSQPLADSLRAIASQTNTNVLFDRVLVRGHIAPPIKAELTAEQALTLVLRGTGITTKTIDDKTVAIVPPTAPRSSSGVLTATLMAQASQGTPGSDSSAEKANGQQALQKKPVEPEPIELADVLITGSRLKQQGNEVQDVRVYSREKIEASGQPTLTGFFNTLPEVSQASVPNPFSTSGSQSTVTLHGFPVGTTLILLDGQRVAPSAFSGGQIFDLNSIPVAAIERIEIVPVGSSAIYGSDGISGVVNIILKKDFSGVAVGASHSFADDYHQNTYDVAMGRKWDRGSLSVFGGYSSNDAVYLGERSFYGGGNFKPYAAQGGADLRTNTCLPGNVSTLNGTNLPGLSSASAAIAAGVDGKPSLSVFTAGAVNLCGTRQAYPIVTAMEQAFFDIHGEYELAASMTSFAQVLYSHTLNEGDIQETRITSTVPATNAFNPFGQAVRVAYRLPVQNGSNLTTDFVRPIFGIKGLAFGGDWELTARLTRIDERNHSLGLAQSQAISGALASADPTTALNPFASPAAANTALLSSLYPSIVDRDHTTSAAGQAVMRLNPLTLPAGPLQLAFGGETEHFSLVDDTTTLTATGASTSVVQGSRNSSAAFLESRVSLLGAYGVSSGNLLALTGSARYDHYSDFGGHFTPQGGLELRPVDSLLLHGMYSTAFRAPTIGAIDLAPVSALLSPIVDPLLGNSSYAVPFGYGPNHHLRPETGRSWSFGATWKPVELADFEASLNRWRIQETDRITFLQAQVAVSNPTVFAGTVTRSVNPDGTTGPITSIQTGYVNFGELVSSGVDLDLAYRIHTGWGVLTPSLAITAVDKFEAALQPDTPLIDRLGRATSSDAWSPRWKGTASLAWQSGPWHASAAARYVGRYLDYQPPTIAHYLGNFAIADASMSADLAAVFPSTKGVTRELSLAVSVINLFNRQPDYSNFLGGTYGYDPQEYDPLGRLIRASLAAKW